MKYLRYSLATFCFAASVGCLLLWCWTLHYSADCIGLGYIWKVSAPYQNISVSVEAMQGDARLDIIKDAFMQTGWQAYGREYTSRHVEDSDYLSQGRRFWVHRVDWRARCGAPLWFISSAFLAVSIAALRFDSRFSLRSALIAITVVTVLLGIVVAM